MLNKVRSETVNVYSGFNYSLPSYPKQSPRNLASDQRMKLLQLN
jgi:hypothetical protein